MAAMPWNKNSSPGGVITVLGIEYNLPFACSCCFWAWPCCLSRLRRRQQQQ